jgi:pimeloyl-ACP methyl ester carboxylesterase
MADTEATPIVLLPGLDGTGELLKDVAERLLPRRPVQLLAYPSDRPLSYAQVAKYVGERVPTEPFVIVGESYSGPIAIEIAATDPRVAGLVLVSSFTRHPLPSQLTAFAALFDLKWVPKSIIAAVLMGSNAAPKLRTQLHQVLGGLPRKIIQTRIVDVLSVDKSDRLREITCPMLCMHGRSDRLVSRKYVDEIILAQPRCQVR